MGKKDEKFYLKLNIVVLLFIIIHAGARKKVNYPFPIWEEGV